MTITKEDQMRAEFELLREEFESAHEDWKFADTKALWFWFYKTCAESYEKKLAEKELTVVELIQHELDITEEYKLVKQQLSEANARNARLVEVLKAFLFEMRGEHGGYHYEPECPYCVCLLNAEKAITANSESVAAWEAEKQATAEAYERLAHASSRQAYRQVRSGRRSKMPPAYSTACFKGNAPAQNGICCLMGSNLQAAHACVCIESRK